MIIIGNFTSGFKELTDKLTKAQQYVPIAIDYALKDTGEKVVDIAVSRSPVDTGTLQESWEINPDNKQTNDNVHSIEVWSNPEIIAMNPKHPDGEYYPFRIENGYTMKNGKWYTGKHMLKVGMSTAKDNLDNNLIKQLGDIFK